MISHCNAFVIFNIKSKKFKNHIDTFNNNNNKKTITTIFINCSNIKKIEKGVWTYLLRPWLQHKNKQCLTSTI